jgi:hypothetical protein
MFIVRRTTTGPAQLRGAELMLSDDHPRSIPLLLTAPEGVDHQVYKHATPTGVKPSLLRRSSFIGD